ncbi:MAG: arginine--tRNA ligase [Gammaproteobacteria bacterium]|nr:arginine--tRNA ligase [Gammaproteobacteria bacterium]
MKEVIQELLGQALHQLVKKDYLPGKVTDHPAADIEITNCPDPAKGDYASNIALKLAKIAGMPPMQLAEMLVEHTSRSRHIAEIRADSPGFINVKLADNCLFKLVVDVLEAGDRYGHKQPEQRQRICVEFVSANPTGPLHVGHGRGAAYGATLSALLDAAGYDVHREYYVNDHGRQMDILAVSVWLRYLELCGEQVSFPVSGYRGDYVYDIARLIRNEHGDHLRHNRFEVSDQLPADASEDGSSGDKEKHIDALIRRARALLGEDGFRIVFKSALQAMLDNIRTDLAEFGVEFDEWFEEHKLDQSGAIDDAIQRLRDAGHIYEQDGAQWFRATEFGDTQDRVVIRDNGRKTYFASDIAYLESKLKRGFKPAIYSFGADHHGYIPRLKAVAQGLGHDPDDIEILLVQFANLFRGGERLSMSTRSGEFTELRQLREEVGNDVARYYYIMRSHNQHMDFDLELAKENDLDNPIYYIQYAHARIASLFRKLEAEGVRYNQAIGIASIKLLTNDYEQQLIRGLLEYPEIIQSAAEKRSPHILAHFTHELARKLHSYYNAERILVDDENLRNARMALLTATAQVLRNALRIMGCSAPEQM